VLFCDETKFTGNDTTSYWVQREPNTDYLPENIIGYRPHPIKINAWGCFADAGVGTLYTFTETLNGQLMKSIFDTCLLESAEKLFHLPMQWYLLLDNSSNHKDKSVKKWLHDHGITVMDFPPYSPDLNPIENLWAHMKRRVKDHVVADVEELQTAVHDEWEKTDIEWIHRTVRSMPDRCEQVVAARGLYIHY
jgi:DDE superfamily endonuclease